MDLLSAAEASGTYSVAPPLAPPPPPPPVSHTNQRQRQHQHPQSQISPNLYLTSDDNCNNSYNGFAHTVAQIPCSLIRPTTAGLFNKSPGAPIFTGELESNNNNNFLKPNNVSPTPFGNRSLSSPEFKEELIKRQSKFCDSSVPVEERIKQRQQVQQQQITKPKAKLSAEAEAEAEMVFKNRSNIMAQQVLPEKLLLTAQREKKPFAYSPDVNDPNDRGKLDLSQIKSPIMRRRLLANLQSAESLNDDDDNDDDEAVNANVHGEELGESSLFNHNDNVRLIREQQNGLFSEKKPNFQIRHHESIKLENLNGFGKENNLSRTLPINYNNVIQYYNKPVFMNTSYNDHLPPSSSRLIEQKVEEHSSTNYYNQFSEPPPTCPTMIASSSTSLHNNNNNHNSQRQRRLDELSSEVDQSLNSLSEFVSNLNFADRTNHTDNSYRNQEETFKQRMSSFSPNNYQSQHFRGDDPRQRSLPTTMNTNYAPMVNKNNNQHNHNEYACDRSIGDYLLSPDSSYFSTFSSPTLSPCPNYYGSPRQDELNMNHLANARAGHFN